MTLADLLSQLPGAIVDYSVAILCLCLAIIAARVAFFAVTGV